MLRGLMDVPSGFPRKIKYDRRAMEEVHKVGSRQPRGYFRFCKDRGYAHPGPPGFEAKLETICSAPITGGFIPCKANLDISADADAQEREF